MANLSLSYSTTVTGTNTFTINWTITNSGSDSYSSPQWMVSFLDYYLASLIESSGCFAYSNGQVGRYKLYIINPDDSTREIPAGSSVNFVTSFETSDINIKGPLNPLLNSPPTTATTVYPVPTANITEQPFTLQLQAVQAAQEYKLELSQNSDFSDPQYFNSSDPFFYFEDLVPGTYYSQAYVYNRFGEAPVSTVYQFIVADPSLAVPSLSEATPISPNNLAVQWSYNEPADSFSLIIATNNDFTQIYAYYNIPNTDNSFQAEVPSGTYYLEIAALYGNTASYFSSPAVVINVQ